MITRRTPVDSPFARIIDRMIDHAAREHGTPAQFNGEFATDTVLPMDVEDRDRSLQANCQQGIFDS